MVCRFPSPASRYGLGRSVSFGLVLAAAVALAACGDEEDSDATSDTGADVGTDTIDDTGGVDAPDAEDDAPDTLVPDTTPDTMPDAEPDGPTPGLPFPDGDYLVGVSLAPVGGIELTFKVEATDGDLALFAYDGTDISDEMGRASQVVVSNGEFFADFGTSTLPAAFSPTSSAVVVSFTLEGTLSGDGTGCGDMDGQIVTLRLPLAGSTFGLIPWEDRNDGARVGCTAREPLPRLAVADCPAISAGSTEDFASAGEDRAFELVLPSDYDAANSYPIVFAFHGFGGDPGSMLDDAGLRPYADDRGLILVSPLGLDTGNGPLWNVTASAAVNEDIALFDDLVTCLSDQYSVDSNQIFATGMSYGGLMTGALITQRSDVLAAAAPFSGGFIRDLEDGAPVIPTLVTWGGVSDTAYQQNFNTFAQNMISDLRDADAFVVACNHNDGHSISAGYWPWALDFLLAHPKGTADAFDGTLPDSFPAFCQIAD